MKYQHLILLILVQLALITPILCSAKVHKSKSKISPKLDEEHYANKMHKESPAGRDKYEQILEDSIFLEVQKLTPSEAGKDAQYESVVAKLNRNALFYQKTDSSYRGVLGSIQLSEIIVKEDKPEKGECCKQVSEVEKKQIIVLGVSKDVKCFKIQALYDKWSLCFEDLDLANTWRRNLIMRIIIQSLEKKGIYNVNFVNQLSKKQPKNKHFTWTEQDTWGFNCHKGQAQSPVQIQTKDAQSLNNMRLKLDLHSHLFDEQFTQSENKEVKAKAVYDGSQVSVLGNFGTIVHEFNENYNAFKINKVQFKFHSEHTIDDQEYDAEVLIHAVTQQGLKSITSVLLKADEEDLADENKFLDDVDSEAWNFKVGKAVELAKKPNLEDLVSDVLQKKFALSFYWYMGSETEPNCEEGVNRFVIDVPITVPKQQLDTIKVHAYDNQKEGNGNFRIPIAFESSRQLYHHQEKICPAEKKTKTVATVEVDAKLVNDTPAVSPEKKTEECEKPAKKIIKAVSEVSSYTFTDKNILTGQIKDGVKIENVQATEVPGKIASVLREQADLEAQQNCKKNRLLKKQKGLEHRKKNYEQNYKTGANAELLSY